MQIIFRICNFKEMESPNKFFLPNNRVSLAKNNIVEYCGQKLFKLFKVEDKTDDLQCDSVV